MRRAVRLVSVAFLASLANACGTVDLGTYEGVRDLKLDENFFYCKVQPTVLTAKKCSSGDTSQGDPSGGCHSNKSAMILIDLTTPTACGPDGKTVAPPSVAERANFQAASLRAYRDVESSPLLQRPTGQQSHPRTIFDTASPEANTVRQWISGGR